MNNLTIADLEDVLKKHSAELDGRLLIKELIEHCRSLDEHLSLIENTLTLPDLLERQHGLIQLHLLLAVVSNAVAQKHLR
jgi:hypothetical protein